MTDERQKLYGDDDEWYSSVVILFIQHQQVCISVSPLINVQKQTHSLLLPPEHSFGPSTPFNTPMLVKKRKPRCPMS